MTKTIKTDANFIKALTRYECTQSFYFFVRHFWNTIIAEEPVWNWHIKYLCDELQKIGERVKQRLPKEYDYYIINVPPGSSKSTVISIMYPLWCWCIDGTQRFICGSYAATTAEDIAAKCFGVFNSEKHRALFPEMHGRNTVGGKTHFTNGLLGERYTTTTGSTITGVHAHQKIIDDPMNPLVAASATERSTSNKWISETISSRDVDKTVTVTILVMQRLHDMDSTGYLLAKQSEGLRIKHICLPAEISDANAGDVQPQSLVSFYKDGLFDPKRMPPSVLQAARVYYGSYGFAGQMLQRPSPPEGGIIKKHWFGKIERTKAPVTAVVHFQMDPAYTEKTKNDPTGIMAYYVENNDIFVINSQTVYKEFPDLIKWIPGFVKENGYTNESKIWVEPKGPGITVVQTIRELTDLNIIESEAPKDDKETGLQTVSPKIEAGRVKLHNSGAGGWNDVFINQITSFPNAQHDEEVDELVAIIKRELWSEETGETNYLSWFT